MVQITTSQGSGSGFVADTDGHILTNHHVIAGSDEVDVTFPGTTSPVPGTVLGVDPGDDLAVVKVDLPAGVKPLPLGDSTQVEVGETAIAIGNPFELDGTLTAGVISGVGRSMATASGRTVRDAIQTDAAINPGNSGGPLLNLQGEVVGINTQIENPTGQGNIGIGFAVPINAAKQHLPQMIQGEDIRHAYLGVSGTMVDKSVAEQYSLSVDSGVLILSVVPGGPADDAGLRGGGRPPDGGDVIVKIGGQDVKTFEDLVSVIDQHQPGDTVEVVVQRGDSQETVEVTLGEWPSQ